MTIFILLFLVKLRIKGIPKNILALRSKVRYFMQPIEEPSLG